MKSVYIILIFISLVSAQLKILNITNNGSLDANINDIVDEFIPAISQFIIESNLDPLSLPQRQIKLWTNSANTVTTYETNAMIYKADLILHSGILKYLSNLKRYGNSTLNYKNKILKLDTSFEFATLKGTFNYTINMVFFNLKGRIVASTTNVRTKVVMTFDMKDYILSLDKFELEVPGNINVIIQNKNGRVDWLNTFIAYIAVPFFKNTLINSVEEQAANTIRKYFDEVNRLIVKPHPILENYKYRINIT